MCENEFCNAICIYKLCTLLYRDKSGGGKVVPQQYSGNHVLKHDIFSTVYLKLYTVRL